jgi:uncharacterized protein (DUF2141 family)
MKYRISARGRVICFAIALILTNSVAALSAQALDVKVKGLHNTNGDVVICVWRQEDKGFPNCGTGQPFKKLTASATQPQVSFDDLPPGTYAVSMFHDEKRTGKPETNLVGMPRSGIGMANDPALGLTSPPSFEKGRITVPDAKSIEITARYLF